MSTCKISGFAPSVSLFQSWELSWGSQTVEPWSWNPMSNKTKQNGTSETWKAPACFSTGTALACKGRREPRRKACGLRSRRHQSTPGGNNLRGQSVSVLPHGFCFPHRPIPTIWAVTVPSEDMLERKDGFQKTVWTRFLESETRR